MNLVNYSVPTRTKRKGPRLPVGPVPGNTHPSLWVVDLLLTRRDLDLKDESERDRDLEVTHGPIEYVEGKWIEGNLRFSSV